MRAPLERFPGPPPRLSEDELGRRLVESVTDYAIFALDPEGRVMTWNPGAERIKGYQPDEILGQHFSIFYPPESVAAGVPQRILARAEQEGRSEDEGWRLRKDGSRMWANCTVTPIRESDGRLVGFAKVTRDLTDRRNAVLLAEQQRRQLAAILDCLSDGVTVCDREGRFIHQNRAAQELVAGLPAARGVADSISTLGLFKADGVTPFPLQESTLLRALAGHSSDDVEAVMRNPAHPDGIFLSINARPVRDPEGQIIGAVVVARDVTRRKQAERELGRQAMLLRSVLDCVVDAVAVYDVEGRMMLSNPAFAQMAGRRFEADASAEERLEHYGMFTADGQRRLTVEESPANLAIRGEVVRDLELVIRTPADPDGLVVSTNAQRLLDAGGQVLGAVVTGRDVTGRKVAENKLLEQRRLLASILDCLGEAVIVYDLVGHILLTNAAADRLLKDVGAGATFAERMQGRRIFTLDGSRELSFEESAVSRALKGESVDDMETMVRSAAHPEGVCFSTASRPLYDRNGQICAAVSTVRDISTRQSAELERERLLAELHRSNVELSQFAYVASHDLRAPLRAIDSLANWLQEDLAPHFTPETAEQMYLLRNRVSRMDGLLRDLLEFSRVGRVQVEIRPVDIDQLITEAIDLIGPPPTFRIVRNSAVPEFATAVLPLKRVLMNLVSNAIKHHDRPAGEVRITTRDRGRFVEIEIGDDGPGIPEQFHRKIFEMFQTLKPRDSLEGSGMGLTFVKKIVESAGGSVAVESKGRGTTFRVTWPKTWPVSSAGGP